jgi:capsid protein
MATEPEVNGRSAAEDQSSLRFTSFTDSLLRKVADSVGLTYEQLTADFEPPSRYAQRWRDHMLALEEQRRVFARHYNFHIMGWYWRELCAPAAAAVYQTGA